MHLMLDSFPVVLTLRITMHMNAWSQSFALRDVGELIIVYCTGLPAQVANTVKYQEKKALTNKSFSIAVLSSNT